MKHASSRIGSWVVDNCALQAWSTTAHVVSFVSSGVADSCLFQNQRHQAILFGSCNLDQENRNYQCEAARHAHD
jgi:hypothetical protein